MFATGHFMITTGKTSAALTNPNTKTVFKIILHPAIYYGLGAIFAGLMAGGGALLLTHPFANPHALMMVSFGALTIAAASLGFALNLLTSATPFWILAAGTALTGMAGLFASNLLGAASCFFSALGGFRLGVITTQASQTKE
jgi:hypothetical protein